MFAVSGADASGWPPFPRSDNIVVSKGGTVSVLSDGSKSILDNDLDLEGDILTAELADNVKHGKLTLNADGTFLYEHDGKNTKDDKFTYRAFDGSRNSRKATVTIKIVESANTPPFTVGSPPNQEAVEGVSFRLPLAGYFEDPDAGDTLRFSASGLPGSQRLAIDAITGILSGTPAAADARDNAYTVTITATDSGGLSAALSFRLIIYRDNRADLAVTARVAANPVSVGETMQWNIVVENRGPSGLDSGELVARWSTSGPALSLVAPQDCTISANNSADPSIRCPLVALAAGASKAIAVQGAQNADGDNSMLATAVSDDPVTGNNSALVGGQVVARFSDGPSQILSANGSDIASGDLNGDGHVDLVVAAEQTVIFFNDGKRAVVTPGTSLGANSGGVAAVIIDWNGDGSPDIAVAGVAGSAGRIYLNNGSGNFSQEFDLKYANSATILAAAGADFAQDGFADLVLTGTGGSHLLRSTGQQGFSLTSLPAGPGIDVSIADINNDTFADILIVESGSRTVRVLRNSGNGRTFNAEGLQRGSIAGVTGADLNGNGRVDLLLAADGADLTIPESRILYQRSDGTFPSGEKIGASPLSKLLAGDVDGDSLPDIVALNDAGVHQLYRGNSGGGFVLQPEQIVSAGMSRGVMLDFNSDQSLDLIMAGRKSSVVEIHANNGIGSLGRGDRDAPVIQMNGEAVVTLAAGAAYEDPGVIATDAIDGDLTDSVVTEGSFNTGVVGSYTVKYSVFDRAGNLGTATRVIKVGVNDGVGGGGGGAISLLFLLLQSLVLVFAWYLRVTLAQADRR
jgi:VCBS repeat-containing protein